MENLVTPASASNGQSSVPSCSTEEVQREVTQVQHPDQPLPRPPRRPKRAKADRGLPPDKELERLAAEYLKRQHKHWPQLVKVGLLPEPTADVVTQMVTEFKHRHRTGQVDPDSLGVFRKHCTTMAGSYNRYSCDNSSPLSIIDQMVNSLDKASEEARFIPWAYIFCDYSVSGLDSSRQGYTSYKRVLVQTEQLIETTYVDDFTRASRDEIEWWKLAALSKKLNKRMVGSSDGFDLSAPDSDIKITFYGLISRLFIKSLREKVRRGMRGAARRRTVLGSLSLGFTRCVCRDEAGNVICGPDGAPKHTPCHDSETAPYRQLLYELFGDKCWSPYAITKHFNALKVDGSDGWTEGAIKKLLYNPDSIGVFIWNRTRREYDWDAKKWVVVKNPRSEWEVYYDPSLALIPVAQFRVTRRKLAAMRFKSPLTGRKKSRNQVSASTLFSGTLFCGYCENSELKLNRSDGVYKVMGCLSGRNHAHGCQLTTSKSVRIIEDSLLGFINNHILTEDSVDALVEKANAYLVEEARKPRVDTAPLKAEIQRREAKIKKFFLRLDKAKDEALCQAYEKDISSEQQEVNRLRSELRQAEATNAPPPPPLDKEQVMGYLSDVRALLNNEIPAAADAIRGLTGLIRIHQEPDPSRKRGARWLATFTPDLAGAMRCAARDSGGSIPAVVHGVEPQSVTLAIEKIPAYETLAPKFKSLRDNGASVQSIASAHQMSWDYATKILHYADTGERPKFRAGRRTGKGPGKPTKYIAIAQEVARMRDEKKMSFVQIAAELKVSDNTVRRAYDHANPRPAREAAETGDAPDRGQYTNLGPDKHQAIRELLVAGEKPGAIAAKIGCGINTVYRAQRELRGSSENRTAPPD